jgi:hypothetical protein
MVDELDELKQSVDELVKSGGLRGKKQDEGQLISSGVQMEWKRA